jgi:hypothetical protein
MKNKCGYCSHFESKGLITGSTNWGLCSKVKKAVIDNGESPFFRWEDDTCPEFEAKKELSSSHKHSSKT